MITSIESAVVQFEAFCRENSSQFDDSTKRVYLRKFLKEVCPDEILTKEDIALSEEEKLPGRSSLTDKIDDGGSLEEVVIDISAAIRRMQAVSNSKVA